MFQIQQARKGSSELLILSILDDAPLHGYAIMRELEARSEGNFTMTAALLYPTLHKMESDHLIEGIWEKSQGDRQKKVYSITPHGREQLAESRKEWKSFFNKFFNVINPVEMNKKPNEY